MSSEQTTTKENVTMNAGKPKTMVSRPLAHRKVLIALLFALGAMLLPAANASAAGTPVWSIHSTGMPLFAPGAPFNLQNGPQFYVRAVNVGNAAMTAGQKITITDTISGPAGVEPQFGFGNDGRFNEIECEESSVQTMTCVDEVEAGSIQPGQQIQISIWLAGIPSDAAGTVVNHVTISGGGAAAASTTSEAPISATEAPWGFLPDAAGFETVLRNSNGEEDTEAGTHPYTLTVTDRFPAKRTGGVLNVPEHLRDLRVDLPAGVILNPNSTPVRCTEKQLESDQEFKGCPAGTQVGTVAFGLVLGRPTTAPQTLYNMVPPPGHAAEFGLDVEGLGIYIHFVAGVRHGPGGYRLTATASDINAKLPILGTEVTFWGDPSDASHNWQRGGCAEEPTAQCPKAAAERALHPLLTMPTACPGERTVEAVADSWENEGVFKSASYNLPSGVSGCNELDFEPTLEARPTTEAGDSPTGLSVDVHVPQTNRISEKATANLRKAVVTLPEGLVLNPSAANGLEACSSAQIGFDNATGQPNDNPTSCPNASKIGDVEVDTPLLPNVLPGSIYLATPYDNPFNSLVAIYAVVNDPATGVLLKLAGHVETDPNTGRLTTTFDDNPQLPFTDFKLRFFGGAGATLRTPAVCGTYSTTSEMTPWSAPESGPPAAPADSYPISSHCASSEGAQANAPAFEAGTESPVAGKYTPFVVHLKREDGSQPFSKLTLSPPPPGLIAKLAGTPACSDAALAAAAAKSGREEQSSPSCPADTKIGTVHVGAGAGPAPYYTNGSAYLAGPYKSAPLSMAIVTPAVAGPFDLGTVVTRVALRVNPVTTRITAEADPIPAILKGIPLDVRSIDLALDKPEFTRTGTSCNPLAVNGLMTSTLGQSASLESRSQLGNCTNLSFGPSLSVRLIGPTKRNQNPKLVANLKVKEGEANISAVSVRLAHSSFLDQSHIRTVCTRVQFAAGAGNGAECPRGSIYGRAQATSPVLGYPLAGNVYLRSSSHELPDLVVALQGPAYQPIAIELDGRTDAVKGALRNSFETVPDAPVSSFRLELFGGKRGLIVNSRDICAQTYRATINIAGQNGASVVRRPPVQAQCSAKGKGHKTSKHRGA